MGHATLIVGKAEEEIAFYQDVMGMHLRETTFQKTAFFGVNPRQHSLGMLGVLPDDAPPQLMHLMIEVDDIDDVGRAQDKCLDGAGPVSISMGKHWNDHVVSFYTQTPSGWDIEYGAGGRRVDDTADWSQVHQAGVPGASVWGHRVVLPDGSLGPNVGNQL
ncbi:VOC family protein [Actinomycetospora sp. C-140]